MTTHEKVTPKDGLRSEEVMDLSRTSYVPPHPLQWCPQT
jgi:hypothetical protein